MEDKKIPFTEDGRVDLDATLLMLHLLRRLREEGLINWETYRKCVRDIRSDKT